MSTQDKSFVRFVLAVLLLFILSLAACTAEGDRRQDAVDESNVHFTSFDSILTAYVELDPALKDAYMLDAQLMGTAQAVVAALLTITCALVLVACWKWLKYQVAVNYKSIDDMIANYVLVGIIALIGIVISGFWVSVALRTLVNPQFYILRTLSGYIGTFH